MTMARAEPPIMAGRRRGEPWLGRRRGGRPRRTRRLPALACCSGPIRPLAVTTACPALTSSIPDSCSTRSIPLSTTVISSNSGRWPGSSQPVGESIFATLTPACPEFTRPTNSSMRFGFVPTAWTTVGAAISLGMGDGRSVWRLAARSVRLLANSRLATQSEPRAQRAASPELRAPNPEPRAPNNS